MYDIFLELPIYYVVSKLELGVLSYKNDEDS